MEINNNYCIKFIELEWIFINQQSKRTHIEQTQMALMIVEYYNSNSNNNTLDNFELME